MKDERERIKDERERIKVERLKINKGNKAFSFSPLSFIKN